VVTLPIYEATRNVDIDATPEDCFAVLTDYERMPEWQSGVKECRVLAYDDSGRASEVEYAIDAKLRTVRYRLRHLYDEPHWIGSEYLGGDFRRFEGDYSLTEAHGATHVAFRLRIDPGLRVPGPVAKMLNEAVMGRALDDLEKRVEAVANGAQ
jgi:ribosome-associated toxin RatA of RatAB toxin-antitoxin module